MPGYYPVILNLKGKTCVVIGGGKVAERKVASLVKADANVTLISPNLTKALQRRAAKKEIRFIKDCFKKKYIKGAFLVIGAVNNPEINCRIFKAAVKENLLVNTINSLEECNFLVPSTLEQGDLSISISTSGKSPALAKKIRENLEEQFGKAYKDLLSLMGKLRGEILSRFPDSKSRNKIFQALVESELLELFEKGQKRKAEKKAEEIINRFNK